MYLHAVFFKAPIPRQGQTSRVKRRIKETESYQPVSDRENFHMNWMKKELKSKLRAVVACPQWYVCKCDAQFLTIHVNLTDQSTMLNWCVKCIGLSKFLSWTNSVRVNFKILFFKGIRVMVSLIGWTAGDLVFALDVEYLVGNENQ